jgi:hypothetical protein
VSRCEARRLGRALAFSILLVASAATAGKPATPPPRPAADAGWSLRLPRAEAVEFRGVVSFDAAGSGSYGMLYPAPDPFTFLIAIAAHGATSEAVKNSQKNKLRTEADKVLVPYTATLAALTHRELMERALTASAAGTRGELIEAAVPGGERWVLESVPTFSMTQDQRALVLDNVVTLFPPGAKKPAWANSVHVVSSPLEAADPVAHWTGDDGAELRRATATLLAESLDLFLNDVSTEPPAQKPVHRTVRFPEGSVEKMERAQVVAETCQRLQLRTLRGWLMAVPATAGNAATCLTSPQQAQSTP